MKSITKKLTKISTKSVLNKLFDRHKDIKHAEFYKLCNNNNKSNNFIFLDKNMRF